MVYFLPRFLLSFSASCVLFGQASLSTLLEVEVSTEAELTNELSRMARVSASAGAASQGTSSIIRLSTGVYQMSLNLTSAHSGLTIAASDKNEDGAVVLQGTHVVRGAFGVTFRGITFIAPSHNHQQLQQQSSSSDSATSPALLVDGGSESVEVDQCNIEGGVKVQGGVSHRIHHSRITNPRGGHCVWIAACGDMTQVPWRACNTSVDNNVITDCFNATGGPYVPGSAGVLLGCVNGAEVHHNHILRTYSWGVRINNNEYCPSVLNSVRLNRIEHWGQGYDGEKYGEGACMYTYGHWFSPGNVMEYNHCNDGPICIYADDASSGQTFRGNICQNISGTGMKINGGHANVVDGNMFLHSSKPNGLTCRGMGWTAPLNMSNYKSVYACENVFYDNGLYPNGRWGQVLREAKFDQAPWITHWPWYKGWCNDTSFRGQDCDPDNQGYDCYMMPTMNNISATPLVMPAGSHGSDPVSWQPCLNKPANCCPDFVCSKGFNTNDTSVKYDSDPGFVDLAGGDLTLKDDSAIFRDFPTFPRVPFRDIGPKTLGMMLV